MGQPRERSRWIISPAADGLFILGTPLLCAAILLPLSRVLSSEVIWVTVMTFGAVGHHVPGFIRTYGDPRLFRRYRARFIGAPILVFIATYAFAHYSLEGVLLVSLVWGIWHGMMQHYGFMRIYEAKAGTGDRTTGRFDFALTLSWFAMCLTLSPQQSGSILEGLYAAGFWDVPENLLAVAQPIAIGTTGLVTVLYIAHHAKRGLRISALKLALLGGTFALVYVARAATADPFLSVALFELLHDVQYLAIVWAFNRRLADRRALSGRFASFVFGPSPWALMAYVGLCAVYGGVAFATHQGLADSPLKTLMVALLTTSAILHFYYDGFIWKVREQHTREGLDLTDSRLGPGRPTWRRDLVHAGLITLTLAALAALEGSRPQRNPLDLARRMAATVPSSSTAHQNLAVELLGTGAPLEALREVNQALALHPTLGVGHQVRGDSLMALRDAPAAIASYRRAIELGTDTAQVRNNLALGLMATHQLDEAGLHLRAALALDSAHAGAHLNMGLWHDRQRRPEAALESFDRAIARNPRLVQAHNNRGGVLLRLDRQAEAAASFRRALALDPGFEPARANLKRAMTQPAR